MDEKIYLDNSATTPLCEAARRAMADAMDCYGNPSSLHILGQQSEKLVRTAREQILSALGVRRGQGTAVFTSCGTEATSLALFGCAYAKERREASRILTTDSEHPATSEALAVLERDGFEIVRIPTKGGALDMQALESALDKRIFMASFMLVNNETGALYSVKEAFSKIKRRYPEAITHCDAIQGFMRVRFSPSGLGAELVSVSGHKIHAPKGVGALYIDAGLIKAKKIVPFLRGGGQESGMRSGTENVIGICAFGAAAEDMNKRRSEIEAHLAELYSYAVGRIADLGIQLNRPMGARVDHIINITLPDIKSETMLHHLSARGVFVSSGSACSSHSSKPSGSLIAFGLAPHMADCSLRISLSQYNTSAHIDALCEGLRDGIDNLVRIKR
ncbi:MAG: aminotransferase class V-fold PLP-dependent enzyme [Clostridia bacterium]|nr:aminotransferase class V-fold PLP-dependent enzyme [Clostridia bacterium]